MPLERPTYSLRRRLLLWLILPLAAIGLVALFDAYRSARQTADEISDRVLAGSALAIAERVFVNDDGELEVDIPYVALDMLTSSADDRVFYRIEGPDAVFITGYQRLAVPDGFDRSERGLGFADGSFRGDPIRVAVFSGAAASDTLSLAYRVAVAETTNARTEMARSILLRTALRQAVLILAAALIVWFGVTSALRPLQRLQEAVGRRSPDDLRPIRHRVPSEVSGLVATINDLVKRFGRSISALRNFTANASHQLRTPLTVMRTQMEIAHRANDRGELERALHETDTAIGEAERVLSQMLLLARIDSTAEQDPAHHRCDVAQIGRELCEETIARTIDTDVDIGYEGPDSLIVRADAILLREMLRNLIDNALRHGGRPIAVTMHTCSDRDGATVMVEDDGIGIPADQRDAMLSRFQRGADNRTEGSGLGLAIAAEIADLFGAELTLKEASCGHGLLVSARFRRG